MEHNCESPEVASGALPAVEAGMPSPKENLDYNSLRQTWDTHTGRQTDKGTTLTEELTDWITKGVTAVDH
jgi:hypothetical protein